MKTGIVNKTAYSIKASNNASSIINQLIYLNKANTVKYENSKKLFLEKFCFQIECHYYKSNFKIEQLTSMMAMSKRQLYRKCSDYLQMKPAEFLREFRLNEAVQLIKDGEIISNIALETGFSTHSSFSRCFK